MSAEDDVFHPLQSAWTLYFVSQANKQRVPATSTAWENHMKELYTFATVEDFWRLWNAITEAGDMLGDYFLFRKDIKPSWEDPANSKGGAIKLMGIPQISPSDKDRLNKFWLSTVLALIGESMEPSEAITGVNLACRSKGGCRICVWTKDANDIETNKSLARRLKTTLETIATFKYERHVAIEGEGQYLFEV